MRAICAARLEAYHDRLNVIAQYANIVALYKHGQSLRNKILVTETYMVEGEEIKLLSWTSKNVGYVMNVF